MDLQRARRASLCAFGLLLATTSAFSQKTQVTGFVDANGGQQIFYLDANSNLNRVYFIGGIAWGSQNLTGTYGGSTPNANSALTSFVDASGGEHIFYVDANNSLNQMYYPGTGTTWYPQNISGVFGGAGVGNVSLASFYDPFDNSQHVFYIANTVLQPTNPIAGGPGPTAPVWQFYYPGNGTTWIAQNLSDTYSADAALANSQVTAFLDILGGEHVVYQNSTGQIDQLYYPGSGTVWIPQNLTSLYASGSTAPVSPSGLTSFVDPQGSQHVVYIDANQNIAQLVYILGTSFWVPQNLTTLAGGSNAGTGSNLASYFDVSGGQHIVYVDGSGNIGQLYYPGFGTSWSSQNLTGTYGGNAAGGATGLVAFPGTAADAVGALSFGLGEHVAYLDANDHVNQFFYPGSGTVWYWQNLSSYGGSTPALQPGSSLSIESDDSSDH
jgi:hypothetical protein